MKIQWHEANGVHVGACEVGRDPVIFGEARVDHEGVHVTAWSPCDEIMRLSGGAFTTEDLETKLHKAATLMCSMVMKSAVRWLVYSARDAGLADANGNSIQCRINIAYPTDAQLDMLTTYHAALNYRDALDAEWARRRSGAEDV